MVWLALIGPSVNYIQRIQGGGILAAGECSIYISRIYWYRNSRYVNLDETH